MEKSKVVPVEPTEEMIEAGILNAHGHKAEWEIRLFYKLFYEGAIAAAPQQQGEPVAWLIPHLIDVHGAKWTSLRKDLHEVMHGTLGWSADVFCDTQDVPVVDRDGVKHYPKPLFTLSPSYDQGFAEAIEAAAKVGKDAETMWGVAWIAKYGEITCEQAIQQLKPPTDTITMSRDELRALIEEIEAIMKGEHGSDWADHFATLFDRLYTVSRALEGK